MRVNDRLIELVDVATGLRSASELGEISPGEMRRLSELRVVFQAFSIQTESAPVSAIESVKAFLPIKPIQIFKARLGQTSLATVGARFETADQFQATYETDQHEIRMSFERTTMGWNVMGKLPEGIWEIRAKDILVVSDAAGRFELQIDDISNAEWRMRTVSAEIVLPSLRKAVSGDTA